MGCNSSLATDVSENNKPKNDKKNSKENQETIEPTKE